MVAHPDLEAEQAYIDHAYACLDAARQRTLDLRRLSSIGPGGTHQARYESEIVEDTIRARLAPLHLGDDLALVFGRIDPEASDDRWYIGRIAVADETQDPVVIDWRAPVAEPFYRATGRNPMGLTRRRHFATRGERLLDIEDEIFGAALAARGGAAALDGLVGSSALMAALERGRTGRLGDIVATIQTEQDEIIRDELGGVLVVQGGPGTGKTVVALHRAAYLLYTHRFPLEGQGVLVVGPNRLYLRYIERVLPSLGEAGVELAMLSDLIPETVGERRGEQPANLVKGDLRMVSFMAKAVRDRQRPLRDDLEVGFGLMTLRATSEETGRIVRAARRRARTHNAGRRFVEQGLWEVLAASARGELDPEVVHARLRGNDIVREALERMWPVLTPADFLRDLFGSKPLIKLASGTALTEAEQSAMYRERGERDDDGRWTLADVPLLDEARALLGPKTRADEEEARTYGHIVVDEAQDLSPMQLRMLSRRSLGGSMTIVGDIAQATGPWAPRSWQEVLRHLPSRRGHRLRELSIGYRTPASIMTLANRVLAVAAPDLTPPTAVRAGDDEPRLVALDSASELAPHVAALAAVERDAVGDGNVAVVVPDSLLASIADALTAAGVEHGEAQRVGIDAQVNLVPVRYVKGLELDSVIVVEPQRIVDEEPQGLRSLYVALTRATQRLAVVHAEPLPDALASADVAM